MLVAIVQNLSLMIALVVVYQMIFRTWKEGETTSQFLSGALFGTVAVGSMMTPFVFTEGVVIDCRSIVLSVAGFFGGPISALVAALLAVSYRVYMGGAGVPVGIGVITASAVVGTLFYYWRRWSTKKPGIIVLWLFGLVVHVIMVALLALVPEVGPRLALETAPYALILFPFAFVVVCKIFLFREEQLRLEKERRDLEEELRQAQKLEAIGRLAGGVAHDYNNMLAIINGYTELALKQLNGQAQIREYLNAVIEAGNKCARLSQQLLAFARKQPITPVDMELDEAVEKRLEMLRRLISKHITLEWKPGLGAACVRMDPTQLDQILLNLVINARDAIRGQGTITLGTTDLMLGEGNSISADKLSPGRYACLSIHDDGCGMDEYTRSRLFEPFFTTKPYGEGTGLGLATVHGIAAQNGGRITVESNPGQGADFQIYLPIVDSSESSPATGKTQVSTVSSNSLERRRILLVEDESDILMLSRILLEEQGHEVLWSESPAKALDLARQEQGKIDLLVSDVIMPGMNGLELWQELSRHGSLHCIFISGYTADIIHQQGILINPANFLQKPFTAEALLLKIRQVLSSPAGDPLKY